MNQELLNDIRHVLAREVRMEPTAIQPDTELISLANWSSLVMMRVLLALEHDLGLRYDIDQVLDLRAVGDFVRLAPGRDA